MKKVRIIISKILVKLLIFLNEFPYCGIKKSSISLKSNKNDDIKIRFEKSILRLLKRYGIFDNKTTALQKVTIICSVSNPPIIKMETLVINKYD